MRETEAHRHSPSFPGWGPGALHLKTYCIYSLTCRALCRLNIKEMTFWRPVISEGCPVYPLAVPSQMSCPRWGGNMEKEGEKIYLFTHPCWAVYPELSGKVHTVSQEVESDPSPGGEHI